MRPNPAEIVLAAFSTACVAVVGLDRLGWPSFIDLAGSLRVGLYPLYSSAAASGWLLGNVYVKRSATLEPAWRWSVAAFYLLVPVGPFFLFRAMAPLEQQLAAPLVPWFCAGIIAVFFAVPVSLRPRLPARRPRIGSEHKEDVDP